MTDNHRVKEAIDKASERLKENYEKQEIFDIGVGKRLNGEITCKVKVRYRQKEQPAKVYVISDRKVKIEFDTPQRAITPGQAAVLYDGDVVLGGGTIESVI